MPEFKLGFKLNVRDEDIGNEERAIAASQILSESIRREVLKKFEVDPLQADLLGLGEKGRELANETIKPK